MRTVIPRSDYEVRANQHRPTDLGQIRATIRSMLDEGYGEHTIADALGMHVEAIRRIAGCPTCG